MKAAFPTYSEHLLPLLGLAKTPWSIDASLAEHVAAIPNNHKAKKNAAQTLTRRDLPYHWSWTTNVQEGHAV